MIKKYFEDLLSLLYPNICYNCDTILVDGEEKICLRCYRDFPLALYHLSEQNPLLSITSGMMKIEDAFCYLKFNKQGIAQKLLHELKYKGDISIGLLLGQWFGNHIKNELLNAKIDFIIPLPLHRSRERSRGFNQSKIIARGMSKVSGISINEEVLFRTRSIATQTKKGKVDRWQNARSMYKVLDAEAIEGKNVLLVDDVVTTGATICSALEVLAKTNVNRLFFGCIASGK